MKAEHLAFLLTSEALSQRHQTAHLLLAAAVFAGSSKKKNLHHWNADMYLDSSRFSIQSDYFVDMKSVSIETYCFDRK